jgi:hypothetical protein
MQLLHTLHNATSPQSSLHGKSSEKSLWWEKKLEIEFNIVYWSFITIGDIEGD